MHLVFISSILTLSHTGLYPESPAPWPSADPFIRRSNETYNPAGCSIAETLKELHSAFGSFHRELNANLARNERMTYFISPIAVSLAMYLLTAAPISQYTLPDTPGLAERVCIDKMSAQPFIDWLNGYASTGLTTAASVFVSPKVNLRPDFIQTVTKTFRTPIRKLNFEETTERQDFISRWSDGKVQSLVNADTSMAVVNVVHYKGEWVHKFKPERTHYLEETDKEGNIKDMTLTMWSSGSFLHGSYDELNTSFVEYPLVSKDGQKHVSLFVIQRDEILKSSPLYNPSHHMANFSIEELRSRGVLKETFVFLPKVKITSRVDIKPAVEGIRPGQSIFEQQTTRLSHVANAPSLVGDKFVQRTSIEINEDGIELTTIDSSADPPAPGPSSYGGNKYQTLYFLLATTDDTPQIIFSGRGYR